MDLRIPVKNDAKTCPFTLLSRNKPDKVARNIPDRVARSMPDNILTHMRAKEIGNNPDKEAGKNQNFPTSIKGRLPQLTTRQTPAQHNSSSSSSPDAAKAMMTPNPDQNDEDILSKIGNRQTKVVKQSKGAYKFKFLYYGKIVFNYR